MRRRLGTMTKEKWSGSYPCLKAFLEEFLSFLRIFSKGALSLFKGLLKGILSFLRLLLFLRFSDTFP